MDFEFHRPCILDHSNEWILHSTSADSGFHILVPNLELLHLVFIFMVFFFPLFFFFTSKVKSVIVSASDQFDQFKIRTTYEATSFGQPYDFQSIMHYTNKEFSSNGEDTIQAIANPNMALGNINSMSAVDVLQVNLLYKCPEAQRKGEPPTPVD